jgi:hypothetical protein
MDIYDIVAFVLFGGIVAVMVQVVVTLGSLPGQIGKKRVHPHAAAINIASWIGIGSLALGAVLTGPDSRTFTTAGALWPLALVWAYLKPIADVSPLAEPQHQRLGGEEVAS